MKRSAGWLLTLAAVGGCVSTGDHCGGLGCGPGGMAPPRPPALKGAVGPWGEPVAALPPVGPHAPGAMGGIGPEVPFAHPGMMPGPGMLPPNHLVGGPGMNPATCSLGATVQQAGGPGLEGRPGAALLLANAAAGGNGLMLAGGMLPPPGMLHASGAQVGGPPSAFPAQRSQVRFVGPAGAKVGWYVPVPGAESGAALTTQLDVPGRYNFIQASIYRLKLSDIPGRAGLELYPTVEVVPGNPKTDAFLAHNYIPVEFTEEDFDQVTAGNFLTKVIYLPDAQYQGAGGAGGGLEELVSTRLEPGVDPIAEAHRRGHILLVIRVGGIDLETANSPALGTPGQYGAPMNYGGPPAGPGPGGHGMLPGIAPATPGGMPSLPVMMSPPPPQFSAPRMGPNGPMVPPPAGFLPPLQGDGSVQQTAFIVTPDGQTVPVALPPQQSMAGAPTMMMPYSPSGQPMVQETPKTGARAKKGLLDRN